MKAIIYCRVSSQKQVEEGHGLEGQEQRCRQYANSVSYEVVRVFKDEGISGGITDRPGMRELLLFLDKQKNKTVVVIDDIKRLARDVIGHFELRNAIYSRNATLESPSHKFEETPTGKFIETVLAGTSELERSQNAQQVTNRMKARFENGYYCFRSPPKALIYIEDPIHGKLLKKQEPYASIYKEAIEKFEKDILLEQVDVQSFINMKFQEIGLKEKISLSRVTRLLKEILYTGYVEYSRWNIPLQKGKHEGFITIETYKNVINKLQGKKRKPMRKDACLDFSLRGFITCSSCGYPMTGAWCQGRSNKFPYYWCRNKECPLCSKTVRRDDLEVKFKALLHGVKISPENAEFIKTIFLHAWNEEKDSYQVTKLQLNKQRVDLDFKITNLSERIAMTRDDLLVMVYEKQLKLLILNREALDQPTLKKEYSQEEFQTASNLVFETLKEPVRMWQSPDYKNRVTIIKMYFPNKLAYDLKSGFQTAEIEPVINLINSIEPSSNRFVEMARIELASEKTLIKRFSLE